jgi:hypothetical protein
MPHNLTSSEVLPYPKFNVLRRQREPLLEFMIEALESSGCRVLRHSPPSSAPFQISFETPTGEKQGIIAYAFYANQKLTRNRPSNEYRFQLKYGTKTGEEHELWQDPYGIYTTLLLGISPEEKFFVGFDPILHSPTKFFISLEFKDSFVAEIQKAGWASEERDRRDDEDPVEVIVGGRPSSFLRYIQFEREALGEDQGHRAMLAETPAKPSVEDAPEDVDAPSTYVHALSREFEMAPNEVLDLIASAKRLKMAVRGWVAEVHLVKMLQSVDGVSDCHRIEEEGGPDVRLRFENSSLLTVECKNVLRKPNRDGLPRLDFQRTRASKVDPCTRYYGPNDFDLVAACVHALRQQWDYSFAMTAELPPHRKCDGKLSSNIVLNEQWTFDVRGILGRAAKHRG